MKIPVMHIECRTFLIRFFLFLFIKGIDLSCEARNFSITTKDSGEMEHEKLCFRFGSKTEGRNGAKEKEMQ